MHGCSIILLTLLLYLGGAAAGSSEALSKTCAIRGGASLPEVTNMADPEREMDEKEDILVVFSDLDGTLIHYPENGDMPESTTNNELIRLPPSATGMRGIISSKTLQRIQELRRRGVKFVCVSGMRTSTFLKRVPYLPKADAYCTEGGGRIFYPTSNVDKKGAFVVRPHPFDGALDHDLDRFALVEDLKWRTAIESTSGRMPPLSLRELADNPRGMGSLYDRDGLLWDFARHLEEKGFVVDCEGYGTCFRVNRKHQSDAMIDSFGDLTDGTILPWDGLATSVNLDCVDYYPRESGKKNCCQYLAETMYSDKNADKLLPSHSLCLCDDDNDLEMALACKHAYIPRISSESMARIIEKEGGHFTRTYTTEPHVAGHLAAEVALDLILTRVKTLSRPIP